MRPQLGFELEDTMSNLRITGCSIKRAGSILDHSAKIDFVAKLVDKMVAIQLTLGFLDYHLAEKLHKTEYGCFLYNQRMGTAYKPSLVVLSPSIPQQRHSDALKLAMAVLYQVDTRMVYIALNKSGDLRYTTKLPTN